MKLNSTILVYALPLLGLPIGYLTHSWRHPSGHAEQEIRITPDKAPKKTAVGSPAEEGNFPRLVTADTLESLLAQGDELSYASVALWLLDADASEMAAFWENRQGKYFPENMKRLLLINWTRLDPSTAVATTTGTKLERLVWWAWAASDPMAALASAPTLEMKRLAAQGAGEFDPAWVRENFASIPEDCQQAAIGGILTWKEDSDHVATLDFLQEQAGGRNGSIFRSLARKDPWAAYDWLVENNKLKLGRYTGQSEVEELIAQMKELHPDDLERMAAMTPSGAIRWKMEDALFESLLATDPERALKHAREGKAPLFNAQRLAVIGNKLLATDPGKAFQLGGEILAMSAGSLSPMVTVSYEGATNRSAAGDEVAENFFEQLLVKDFSRTLDLVAGSVADRSAENFNKISSNAVAKDLNGYAAWVNQQTHPEIVKQGSSQVVSGLAARGNFPEASEWAMSHYEPKGELPRSLINLTIQWAQRDTQGAGEWLEASPLSENHRATLQSMIRQFSR